MTSQQESNRFVQGCMFCGERQLSKEHLWGKWLFHKETTEEERRSSLGVKHVVSKVDRLGEEYKAPGFLNRKNIHPLGATTKVVCSSCNNGWMSRIEGEMKSVYERLIDRKKVCIEPVMAKHVAAWIYLKSLLYERGTPSLVTDRETLLKVTDEQTRRWQTFKDTRRVPTNVIALIARRRPMDDLEVGAHNFIPYYKLDSALNPLVPKHFFVASPGDFIVVQVPDLIGECSTANSLGMHIDRESGKPTFVNVTQLAMGDQSAELPLHTKVTLKDADDLLLSTIPSGLRKDVRSYSDT